VKSHHYRLHVAVLVQPLSVHSRALEKWKGLLSGVVRYVNSSNNFFEFPSVDSLTLCCPQAPIGASVIYATVSL